jgi:hypothetical protein
MSSFTLHIKNSNKKVLALLKLIRDSEDIVLEENVNDYHLTDVQKSILDQRKVAHLTGASKSFSWDEVKERARAKK